MLKTSPAIFCTITLDPSLYVYKSKVQLDKTLALIQKILSKSYYYGSFELTKQQNIHYHIAILDYPPVKSPLYYWKNKFRRGTSGRLTELGFTKIEILHKTENTFNYINKDTLNTYSILGIYPIFKRVNDIISQHYQILFQEAPEVKVFPRNVSLETEEEIPERRENSLSSMEQQPDTLGVILLGEYAGCCPDI